MAISIIHIYSFLLDHSNIILSNESYAHATFLLYLVDIAQSWVVLFLFLLSDGIIVWRASVVCFGYRWIMIVPCLLFLGTCGTGIAFIGLYSASFDMWKTYINVTDSTSNYLYGASVAMSFGTNAVATLLIIYKLRTHQRSFKEIGRHTKRSFAQRILLIMIESGLVLLALQLVILIMTFTPFALFTWTTYVQMVVYVTLIAFTAVYPSMVIYLVSQQHPDVHTFGFRVSSANESYEMDSIGIMPFERHTEATRTIVA